jgi:hypothetical protein
VDFPEAVPPPTPAPTQNPWVEATSIISIRALYKMILKRVHSHWSLTNNKWLLSFSFGLWHCKSIILKPHTPSLGSWSSCHTFFSLQQYSEIPPDGISSGSAQGRNWITFSLHKWAQ